MGWYSMPTGYDPRTLQTHMYDIPVVDYMYVRCVKKIIVLLRDEERERKEWSSGKLSNPTFLLKPTQ